VTALLSLLLLAAFALYHLAQWRRIRPYIGPAVGEAAEPTSAPLISFLVPAWNAVDDLPAFVAAFRALGYPNKELLLGIGGDDGGLDAAHTLAGDDVRVFEQHPGTGKQRMLRQLYPHARGELIYLTDIDCRPDDGAVAPLILALLAGNDEVVTGSIRPLDEQQDRPFVRTQWAIERVVALQTGESSSGLRGANAALTRTALDASGGFAQEAASGTDYTLAKELTGRGYRIAYRPQSEMPTAYPGDVGTYTRKQARWLRNVALLGVRYGAWGEVRGVAVTLALPFVLIALLLLGTWLPLLALLALLLVAHATLNRLRYARAGGIVVPAGAALSTLLADLGAGLLATSQIVRGQITWS
jgi:cellulose synthase/poly-beta-1,6-N-acetylglucosamine synthase-like glycosyltransferase